MKSAKKWRKLDNAAKIFPPTSSGQDPKVFRFVCELFDEVDDTVLLEATNQTLMEFPFFKYTLRNGVFWYYLEDSDTKIEVNEEDKSPCQPLYTSSTSLLFRVLYFRNRMILEVYHALTDGTGALQFLRTLVCRYLQIKHSDILAGQELPLGFNASSFQRMGDSFDKYYTKKRTAGTKKPRAYKISGEHLPNVDMRVVIGETPVDKLLAVSRERGTTITALLASCLLCAVGEEMKVRDRGKDVVAVIPINLRNYFPSETARNFFSTIHIGVNFNKIPLNIDAVANEFTQKINNKLTLEYLQQRLNSLAYLEKNPILRVLPLALKNPCMKIAGRIVDSKSTVSVSNVGKIDMPEQCKQFIRKFDVFITTSDLQICTCSYDNIMSIGLTSNFVSTDIERRFFRHLTSMGLDVIISATEQTEVI